MITMTTLIDAFRDYRKDRIFFGSENCFRRALQDDQSSASRHWQGAFGQATAGQIEALLEARGADDWHSVRGLAEGEEKRFPTAIRGLCFATAGLLQRNSVLIKEAIKAFGELDLAGNRTVYSPVPPAQQEIAGIRDLQNGAGGDVQELLAEFTGSQDESIATAGWMVADLASRPAADLRSVCTCPVAYAWSENNASILKLMVRCLPSGQPRIMPDLWPGGALLWSVSAIPGANIRAGWKSIAAVWEKLQPWCPGVRVSIGIEEWSASEELPKPVLEGDSIQAATAVAIWHAWSRTVSTAKRRSEIEKIDVRLLDFDLDPLAIVTAALRMEGASPVAWELVGVKNVRAKFQAAGRCGLQLGLTARAKPGEAAIELSGTKLTPMDAGTYPELCEQMCLTSREVREYQKRNLAEWDLDFLSAEEASALIAERDREQSEQES
jgi:hypothetical protein